MRKKIILTTEQFVKLCEDVDTTSNNMLYAQDDANVPQTIKDGIKQMAQNGNTTGTLTITKDINTINNNGSQPNGVSINIGEGGPDDIAKAKEQMRQSGVNSNNVNYQVNVVNGKAMGISECTIYTKKNVQEAYVKSLIENSSSYKKGSLNEKIIFEVNKSYLKKKYINFIDLH